MHLTCTRKSLLNTQQHTQPSGQRLRFPRIYKPMQRQADYTAHNNDTRRKLSDYYYRADGFLLLTANREAVLDGIRSPAAP